MRQTVALYSERHQAGMTRCASFARALVPPRFSLRALARIFIDVSAWRE